MPRKPFDLGIFPWMINRARLMKIISDGASTSEREAEKGQRGDSAFAGRPLGRTFFSDLRHLVRGGDGNSWRPIR